MVKTKKSENGNKVYLLNKSLIKNYLPIFNSAKGMIIKTDIIVMGKGLEKISGKFNYLNN
jgi:hypothetical protein